MINRGEISKWQFIFQFWKETLMLLLCTTFLWGILLEIRQYFDLLPLINDIYIELGMPLVIATLLCFYIDHKLENIYWKGYYLIRSNRFCDFILWVFFIIIIVITNRYVIDFSKNIVTFMAFGSFLAIVIIPTIILWSGLFLLFTKGPYYPIKSHPFFKKTLSSKLRITWLYIRHIFQSQILFIWYIPVISIIVAVIEIAQMGGLIVPNEEVGAATPMSVLENGEYWRLISCVFVHGGFFHIFFELIFYISLANLCCQWYGCRVYESRTLLLYIFYWIGTVAANYFTVKDGYTAIGVIGGEFTLAGLLFISFLTMPKKIREDNVLVLIGLLFFIGFWLFQIYIAHANYVNKALAPKRFVIIDEASYMSIKGVFLALICGIVFQLLLELYYWVKRKDEDKNDTQNYQKGY